MPRNFENYADLKTALDLAPLTPGAFRFAKQYGPATFTCARCRQTKPLNCDDGGGTGYGITTQHMVDRGHVAAPDLMICYQCAGETDKADMIADGAATLYLTHVQFDMVQTHGARRKRLGSFADGKITNWPGTLSIPCRVKVGSHNIARYRYDAWFTGPDGKQWHGVQIGDNTQIVRCKRLKS